MIHTPTFRSSRRHVASLLAGTALMVAGFGAHAQSAKIDLRIGYQKSASLLAWQKKDGSLERRLAPLGVNVTWTEFPAGPQMLEGLNVGAIDVGFVGEAPPIFAQAAGANFVYIGNDLAAPEAEALVVQKDSPIKSVADLKGKKVALNKGSNVHYLLVKVLEKNGLRYGDIQPVFLAPADARAAFEKGAVDAWVIWDPFLAAAEKQIGARVLADGKGAVNNYSYYLSERGFAQKNPQVIKALFEDTQEQGRWIKSNIRQAAVGIGALQGLEPDVVETVLRRYPFGVAPLTPAVAADQQKIADTFRELQLIPKAIRISDALPRHRTMTRTLISRRRLLQGGAASLALPSLWTLAAEAAPPALRIGFQKSAVNLVILKQQGALEKRFPNSKVQWVEFPAGPQLLEALSAGSLEFGLTGDSPPVFAQAAGRDLYYVGAEPPKPLSSAILAPTDSPLRQLSELKGRKVALQKGSSAHYLLVRALDRAALTWNDITPIYLTPSDARAAFERGSVDAWAIWDPYYAAAELDVKPRVLSTGVGLSSNNSFYLASRPLVDRYPASVLALFDELTRADTFVQTERKDAAQHLSDFSGLSLATVHLFLSRRPPSPTRPLPAALIADQQRVADAFLRLGLIPKSVRVSDIVWQPANRG